MKRQWQTLMLLCLGCLGLSEAAFSERRTPDFAQSGGVYSVGARGGVLGQLNTLRAGPEDDINGRLRAGRDEGLVNVVQLSHGHRWNQDREAGAAKLKAWLDRTDLALIDILHFAEEQPYNAATWLDPLYALVKEADPSLPVYVWPSYPLGPMAKADGYVYDAYGEGYTKSRRRLMTFLRTGKPLVMCVDASGFSDYVLAREQFMTCYELDVPVFYFAADSGRGSFNNWYGKPTKALSHGRNFMFSALEFQRRCRVARPIAAGDLIWGELIELAPGRDGKVEFNWSEFGPATVYGLSRLALTGRAVRNEGGGDVALDYQFWSLLPLQDVRLTLDTGRGSDGPSPVVSSSRCGKQDDWQAVPAVAHSESQFVLGDPGREFRLRITLPQGAELRGGNLAGICTLPTDRAIDLDAFYDGWRKKILFDQALDTGLWRAMGKVDRPEALIDGKALALRGQAGRGVRVAVVQKFTSEYPLEEIQVRLRGMSQAALGGSFSLGVSLDGETMLREGVADSERRSDGRFEGEHNVDLRNEPSFQGIKTLYVHLIQANSSGIRGNTSSQLERLCIDAVRSPRKEN